MKIGYKEYPDLCLECGKELVLKPYDRIWVDSSTPFRYFIIECSNIKCIYKSEKVKIREDYLPKDKDNIEDVTPYKHSIITKYLVKFLYYYYEKL